jgi:hypothetical protein
MLVQTIDKVPEELFQTVVDEINTINWQEIVNTNRDKRPVFDSSRTIHLRTHRPPEDGPMPTTINEWSVITECIDRPINMRKYPKVVELAKWMYQRVGGIKLGRIMIVNLLPNGDVSPHIDPLDYFEMHSRYHVPVITNERVVFYDGISNVQEHMPSGVLSRLNNRVVHAVANRGTESRIHIIVDIATPGGNIIF